MRAQGRVLRQHVRVGQSVLWREHMGQSEGVVEITKNAMK
jgi:hypothetical protein